MEEILHQRIDRGIFKEEGTADLTYVCAQNVGQLEHPNGVQAIAGQWLGSIDFRPGNVERFSYLLFQIDDAFFP